MASRSSARGAPGSVHCGIVPPHVLDAMLRHPDPRVRSAARRTAAATRAARAKRPPRLHVTAGRVSAPRPLVRRVFSSCEQPIVPGVLLRCEGQPACGDVDADRAFDAAGVVHAFWREVFARDSIDGHGIHLLKSVHYGKQFDNAFWDGVEMVYGDGDGVVIAGYTGSLDIVAHELTHGVIHSECDLVYKAQTGALSESIADVFGSLVKQWAAHQTVDEADWIIGSEMFTDKVFALGCGRCARRDTRTTIRCWAGAIRRSRTCAISSTRAATTVRCTSTAAFPTTRSTGSLTRSAGMRGARAGHVWYDALRSGLHPQCDFASFAKATLAAARSHGAGAVEALHDAWRAVGVPARALRAHANGAAVPARRVMEYVGVRGHVITAAIAVLADGLPRTSDEICTEALARGLVPAGTSKRYVYTALIEYIARTKGHERKPAIVQDRDRRFRANHPADPWPQPAADVRGAIGPTKSSLAALERVRATARGFDPAEFEVAVCELFGSLGFVATHVGGYGAPDGYLDAPLGPLAYRVMLECKTAQRELRGDRAERRGGGEVPRDVRRGVLSAGRAGVRGGDGVRGRAAHARRVGVDARRSRRRGARGTRSGGASCAVRAGARCRSARRDGVGRGARRGQTGRRDLRCDRGDGGAAAAGRARRGPADAPLLDVDAAMMLLDEHFAASGSTARCSRGDVVAAFDWLTHPRVRRAMWSDQERRAIVVTAALRTLSAEGDVSCSTR